MGNVKSSRGLPSAGTTTTVVVVETLPSARKHGVSDDDIRHAVTNAVAAHSHPDQPEFTVLVGPDTSSGSVGD
jgi:hypothetical protein